jgi:hypothetical protein
MPVDMLRYFFARGHINLQKRIFSAIGITPRPEEERAKKGKDRRERSCGKACL